MKTIVKAPGKASGAPRVSDGSDLGYRADIHPPDRTGITFRWLDGRELAQDGEGRWHEGRWLAAGETPATYYQIPYRCLLPRGAANVLVAGRLVDADEDAFGAVRVMVNCNQTGRRQAWRPGWPSTPDRRSVA